MIYDSQNITFPQINRELKQHKNKKNMKWNKNISIKLAGIPQTICIMFFFRSEVF